VNIAVATLGFKEGFECGQRGCLPADALGVVEINETQLTPGESVEHQRQQLCGI